jgi:serine phosphatase RsbU (regulator of sigma subunit)
VPAQATLGAGDVLLLYTDGVTEARGPAGFFGTERIVSLLGNRPHVDVGDLADEVLKEVTDYASTALGDDVAILAVEREDDGPASTTRSHARR